MSDDDLLPDQDAALDLDPEVMSGGACTPPHGLRSPSPTDSLFDSPRQLLQQIFHSVDPKEVGSSRATSPSLGRADAASRSVPPIPGLYLFQDVISPDQASQAVQAILTSYDFGVASDGSASKNQVMLFGRARSLQTLEVTDEEVGRPSKRRRTDPTLPPEPPADFSSSGLPAWVDDLLAQLRHALQARLDPATFELLFPSSDPPINRQGCQSRQVIINNYQPGEGISPHVDLLQRFGDGILICSFLSGTVMDFRPVALPNEALAHGSKVKHSVYLPRHSVAVLQGPVRYEWTHGIEGRLVDRVETRHGLAELVTRGQRISVTIRWLLPGADVVGTHV